MKENRHFRLIGSGREGGRKRASASIAGEVAMITEWLASITFVIAGSVLFFYRVSHLLMDWVGLTWILGVPLSADSAGADGNLAEAAGQLVKMAGHPNQKQPNLRSTTRWDELYFF